MNRGMTMTCPRCLRQLEELEVRSATIHGCPSCGGVLLDKAQADTVFRRMPGGAALVTASNRAAQLSEKERPLTGGIARCPACAEEMNLCEAEDIRIDQCVVHGTWFDAHELRRIANAETARERSAKAEANAKRNAGAKPANDSSRDEPDAGDWIEAFFDALSELRWPK
jgi:Zn-finger nucleic acid-binding protein